MYTFLFSAMRVTCSSHLILLELIILSILLLFILTANGYLPGGSGNTRTIRHNKQITNVTQNNTTIKKTANYTYIKDTLHRMNTNNHNYYYIKKVKISLLQAVEAPRVARG
jgi:hypothetical protein